MNFNDDDPLGDLLSDGSDDSFFAPKKKPSAVPSGGTAAAATPTGAKSKMENLFGIKNDDLKTVPTTKTPAPPAQKITPKKLPVDAKKEPSSSTSIKSINNPPPSRKEIVFDDDDIFADLGFDPKKPKGAIKKANLFDDLLMGADNTTHEQPTKQPATNRTPSKQPAAAVVAAKTPLAGRSTRSRQSPDEDMMNTSTIRKTPIVQRKPTASKNDPLGFFGTGASSEIQNETVEKQTPKKKGQTSDWLGLGTSSSAPAPPAEMSLAQNIGTSSTESHSNVAPAAQLLLVNAARADTSLSNLQQHETQLMVAIQMKNQELALIEMKRKQHELLVQQEQHFNELLQGQIKRQSDLEHNIQWQQERINSHIHILMAPATSSGIESGAPVIEKSSFQSMPATFSEAEVRHSEAEKQRWDSMLETLKLNHDQEMDLVEKSHR